MKTSVSLISFAVLLVACSTSAMRLDDDLAGAGVMDVQGRQGWQVNQVITFGEYRTGPVKRGWTSGYDYPFTIRFTGAKEKLSFSTVAGSGRQVQTFCAGKLSEQDFHRFKQYFDVNLRTRDVFSCAIADGDARSYEFFVEDLNQNRTSGSVSGTVRGPGVDLSIRPVWHLSGGQRSWDTRPVGLEIVHAGRVVAAIETIDQGRVWFGHSMDDEQRLVIAAVASALLLRNELADHND